MTIICNWSTALLACPFCSLNLTLTERIEQAHDCYVVEWLSGREGNADGGDPGATQLRIVRVFKTTSPAKQVGDELTLPHFSYGQPGEVHLLFGHLRDGEVLSWDGLMACSPDLLDYLDRRPGPELAEAERLSAFIPYLEHPDETIAVDAYSEFGNARYSAVRGVAPRFPRALLLRWITEPAEETGRIARIGLYGMLLGLCGGEQESAALERVILTPGEDFRIGIDGIMAGYLLIRGTPGLEVLKQHALAANAPSSEVFAYQQALKFLWEYAPERIPSDQLRMALRPLVDSPEFAELAIVELARWEDLSLTEKLIDRYSHPDFSNQPTQTAIARYYLTMSTLDPAGRSEADQTTIALAGQRLEELRKRDPELVQHADRFLRSAQRTPTVTEREVPVLAVNAAPHSEGPSSAAGERPGGWLALIAAGAFSLFVLARRLWQLRTTS
ncbi:MAG: hypothetical protein ACK5Q5_14730 [Planctomycetaceae bacterium]